VTLRRVKRDPRKVAQAIAHAVHFRVKPLSHAPNESAPTIHSNSHGGEAIEGPRGGFAAWAAGVDYLALDDGTETAIVSDWAGRLVVEVPLTGLPARIDRLHFARELDPPSGEHFMRRDQTFVNAVPPGAMIAAIVCGIGVGFRPVIADRRVVGWERVPGVMLRLAKENWLFAADVAAARADATLLQLAGPEALREARRQAQALSEGANDAPQAAIAS
jgi:hypothetical protein